MKTPHERVKELNLDEKILDDVVNVLTSLTNFEGRRCSWEILDDLEASKKQITNNHFSERVETALYVLEGHRIIQRDSYGAYRIKNP